MGATGCGKRVSYESTKCWAEQWQQWVCLKIRHTLGIEQATRYLGVFFNMDLSWSGQIQAIRGKFSGHA